MVPSWFTNGLGVGAALCSMSSLAPQVIKLYRSRDAGALSLRMCLLMVTGFALWTAYGLALGSWPLIGSNTVCLLLAAAILALKLRLSSPQASRTRPADGDRRRRAPRQAPPPA